MTYERYIEISAALITAASFYKEGRYPTRDELIAGAMTVGRHRAFTTSPPRLADPNGPYICPIKEFTLEEIYDVFSMPNHSLYSCEWRVATPDEKPSEPRSTH